MMTTYHTPGQQGERAAKAEAREMSPTEQAELLRLLEAVTTELAEALIDNLIPFDFDDDRRAMHQTVHEASALIVKYRPGSSIAVLPPLLD